MVRADLPFYFATKDAAGNSRNALGNISLGLGWNNTFPSWSKDWTFGYAVTLDGYMPTSRKIEGLTASFINPTVDFYRYLPKSTSLVPMVGVYANGQMFSAKINAGFGYTFIPKATAPQIGNTAKEDQNRMSGTVQVGGSWHALPFLNANLEYNSIMLDSETAALGTTTRAKFRHTIVPSVSGNLDQLIASAYVSVPLDAPTRDYSDFAFGINAGYSF